MPTPSQPLASIAMPVYNGDRYICQALDPPNYLLLSVMRDRVCDRSTDLK